MNICEENELDILYMPNMTNHRVVKKNIKAPTKILWDLHIWTDKE